MAKSIKTNGLCSVNENNGSNRGKFVISLDFELFWGLRDKKRIADYKANLLGVQQVIPKMLDIFGKYDVKATFATVGFLFFETKEELLNNLPNVKPLYENDALSPYQYIEGEGIGADYSSDKFHFAPDLIKEIQKHKEQEIATHTFSHYYCLEAGQTLEAFKNDLEKAIEVARKYDINITSLVFPRNQTNEDYLKICADLGIISNKHSIKQIFMTVFKKIKNI